ncbi:HEXXH motif-containing putative peptide modification protein [Micromonospora sp. NPDC094482]|uniref:aKG-HExxH-type peptide beta-hydroxylase n=1 Tax=unclassified Micromonospora TaxID=2617518 RepID=UPI003331B6BE
MAVLSPGQLAGLAAGHGDPTALEVLRGGQLGRRRLLTVAAARAAVDRPLVRQSLALLTRAEETDPAAVAEVLAHPPAAGWARAALAGSADAGYLATLSAAAAVRAGLTFELALSCPDGTLLLPTLGAVAGLAPGVVCLRGAADTLSIRADAAPRAERGPARGVVLFGAAGGRSVRVDVDGEWSPARRIPLGGAREVLLDDQDPWRQQYHRPPASRLDDAAAGRLTRLTGQAWEWISAHLPEHADGLGVLLRSLVPLEPPLSGNPVSATSRNALGAIALSVPADPQTLALLLVHELQHTKLGALLDLLPLHDTGGPPRYRAPWRLDPRPVGALLQGAYAHLGVAEVWRRRRHDGVDAAFEYAYWREQTARAVAQLTGCAELTAAGRAFVAGMAATLRRWQGPGDSPVDARVEAAVRDVADGGALRWGLTNLTPDPDDVRRLTEAWRRGRPRLAGRSTATVTPAAARPALTTGSGPEAAVRRRLLGPSGDPSELDPTDRAYAAGHPTDALPGYRKRLAADPGDVDAWVGLALAARRGGQPAAARVLTGRPDLVRALCRALPDADPLALAAWLAGPTAPDAG